MIVNDIENPSYCAAPLRRIREEADGGKYLDPFFGRISNIEEKDMAVLISEAADNPRTVYYAARRWSKELLSKGCSSAPDRIYFEVTNKCNLHCRMCYRNAGSELSNEMDTTSAMNLIRKLAAIGVHELRFTGGEPTTRDDIPDLIDCAAQCGLFVTLGTNGIWPESLADSIIKKPVGRYLVSLDGPGPVNDSIRGKGSFERAMLTVKMLINTGKNVRVNMLLTRSALKHLDEFAMMCSACGVRHLSMIVPRPAGRAANEEFRNELPTHDDMNNAALAIEPLRNKYGIIIEFQYNVYGRQMIGQSSDPAVQKIMSCPAGREAAFISPDGMLYACGCAPDWAGSRLLKDIFVAGNVLNMSASDIWHCWQFSKVWNVFRDLHKSKSKDCFECRHYGAGCFGSCPIHSYIAEGRFDGPDPMCWI